MFKKSNPLLGSSAEQQGPEPAIYTVFFFNSVTVKDLGLFMNT